MVCHQGTTEKQQRQRRRHDWRSRIRLLTASTSLRDELAVERQPLRPLLLEQQPRQQLPVQRRSLQHQPELGLIELELGPRLQLGPVPRFRLAPGLIVIKVRRSLMVLLKQP